MLSQADNEAITRVGPGTPMGELMRRYWQPVLLSREAAEPDCDPVRVRVLGEDLVAFRDTSGRVGLLAEWCPHRLTSLYLGRNEENGIRCVYHGWKFDVNGACVEMPNEPEEYDFKHKVRTTAYPTVELGGVIWAYMGPPAQRPPEPRFEFTQQPETHRGASKVIEECNWLQALEGGIDSVHSSFLHRKFGSGEGIGLSGLRADATASRVEVEPTDYGYRYTSSRPLPGGDRNYVRAYQWVMPHVQIRASQFNGDGSWYKFKISGHHWVPIDDEHTMVVELVLQPRRAAHHRREGGTDERQRGGLRRPADVPEPRQQAQRLAARPSPPADRHVHGHPGHQPAGPRGAGGDEAHRGPA